jgi:hypothetical protein
MTMPPLGMENPMDPMGGIQGEEALGVDMDAIIREALGESNNPLSPNEQVQPNKPAPDGRSKAERLDALRKALYGGDFPMATKATESDMDAWASWARGLWESRRESVQMHLHLVERNRLFRAGMQWISSNGLGPWREPARPRDAARVVYNMVDKALDQRLQIIMDQRPGFSVTPTTQDPEDRRKAQAQQVALEYQHEQQLMMRIGREAVFWAQTDGVAFWHEQWDPDRGPWDERMGDQPGERKPLGDLVTQTLRVEQVRVSPNATASIPPYWVIIREVISRSEAAFRYGVSGLDAADTTLATGNAPTYNGSEGLGAWVLTQTTIGEGQRLRDEDVTERFTVYVAPHADALPEGLHLVVVGDKVVFGPDRLLWGAIPVVPVRDGSSDPSYYPRPVMEQWLDHQMRVNALLSKWVENIRVNAGGRFLTRPNAISTETFMGGVTSMIEIRGAGSMNDTIQPVQGFSVGNDVKEALSLEKTAFEDASGWNAVSRGQVTGESGRAIIASREQLERVFSPAVNALAMAYTDWAKVTLAGMAWGYDVPRALGAVGKGRPDLARAVSASDFDGISDVKVESASMMPMPMAFRLYLLDNWLQTGVIDAKEYRRRHMFAVSRDISTPDEDQEARAMRVAEAIRMGYQPPEMRWQDNEAIHQDVLERQILLQDDLSPDIIAAAQERWTALANQSSQKQGGGPPPGGPPPGGPPPGGAPPNEAPTGNGPQAASVPAMPPSQLPLASGNPPIGVASLLQQTMSGTDEAEQAAQQADVLSRQA